MSDILHLVDSGRIRCVDGLRSAEFPGERELLLGEINRDDLPGTGGNGTEQRREADTSKADHRCRRSSRQVGRVEYRSNPGEDGATEECGLVERQLRIDLHR